MKPVLVISILSAITFLSAAAFADTSVVCRVSKYETDKQLFLGRVSGVGYLVISPNDEVELQSIGSMKNPGEGTITVASRLEGQQIEMFISELKLVNGYPRTDAGTEITASREGVLSTNLRPRGIKISCKATF